MVEGILLDTDILIEAEKDEEIFNRLRKKILLISVISLYEFVFGEAYIGRDISKVKEKAEEIYYVINLNQPVLNQAIQIDMALSKEGEKLSFRDLIIGATAIVHETPLLTKNVKQFRRLEKFGLKLRNLEDI